MSSIPLEKARYKLDILEKLAIEPKLIFTDLFSGGVADSNFLYQIKINDEYISEYLKKYILSLPVFNDCIIFLNAYNLFVYLPHLRVNKYNNLENDDKIVKIDLGSRTFKLITECIDSYESVMNREHSFIRKELDEFWQRFKDLSFRKRVKYAISSLLSNKRIYLRISDFIFWLTVTKGKIKAALDREQEKVNDFNSYNEKQYTLNIERKSYYQQNAPAHIKYIQKKQREIYEYLTNLGYTEDNEMNIY